MSLLDDITEGDLVSLDTAVWIYQVESHPVFGPIVNPFFQDRLAWGKNRAGSTVLALAELLVQPLALGQTDLANQYRSFFRTSVNFAVWRVTRAIVEEAAALRAKYRLKLIDELHVASGILNGADLLLCNDRGLKRVTELRILVLADYLPRVVP